MATVKTAWDQVSSNIFKTWLIMFLFSVFAFGVIYVISRAWLGPNIDALSIAGVSLVVAGVMNFVSYFWSDKIVLGISGAKPIDEKSHKELYRVVENLCIAAGLPLPKIYLINASATGRDPKHAAIAFTTGILSKLNKQELEGVTAHELSHVGNRDTLLMAVVSVLVGTIATLADFFMRSLWFGGHNNDRDNRGGQIYMILAIATAILAPIIAMLIQLAVSRRREFLADASGVLLTRYPEGLASALEKIDRAGKPLIHVSKAPAPLFIANPLGRGGLAGLFSTHPSVPERVAALRAMASVTPSE